MWNIWGYLVVGNGLCNLGLMIEQGLQFLPGETNEEDRGRIGEDSFVEGLEFLAAHLGWVFEDVEGPTNQVDAVPDDDTVEVPLVHHLSSGIATNCTYKMYLVSIETYVSIVVYSRRLRRRPLVTSFFMASCTLRLLVATPEGPCTA